MRSVRVGAAMLQMQRTAREWQLGEQSGKCREVCAWRGRNLEHDLIILNFLFFGAGAGAQMHEWRRMMQ